MVTMADKTIDLTVAQRGKMMMLDDAPLKFGSTGGKGDIYIITNDKWTATVEDSPSWIQLNPTSGEDSAHVAVTVLSNNYLKERSTHVTIASAYGKKFVVPIQQSMRYLTANVSSFTFLGNGGQQGPLLIKCDGQYSIKNSSAWLTLTKDETSGGYLLYTTPNTGQKQRTDTIVVACTDLLEGKLELKIPVRQVSNVTDLTLTVDDAPVLLDSATAGVGYVRTQVDHGDLRQVSIAKNTGQLAWGALYGQSLQDVGKVADDAQGLSVERELVLPDRPLRVGDKIVVRITVKADRNYDFVQVCDRRPACLEPVNALSNYHWGYYSAKKDNATIYYFDHLGKGERVLEEEYYVDREGAYTSGTCVAQCAYAPEFKGIDGAYQLKVSR